MFFPMLLLVFWTGLMIAADFATIQNSVRQAGSVHFASTIGRMVQSEIGKGPVSHRGVTIGYNYTVNGVNYTGHRYRYDDRNAAWEYSSAVEAFPRWSARTVYYNADNPADSVLDPGLEGCDLLLPLFAMPLNALTVALWMTAARSMRGKPGSEPAGGVRIIKRGGETRAQLAAFSSAGAALAGLGGSSFVLAFPVVSMGGFAPGMTMMLVVWSLVASSAVIAFVWRFKIIHSGRCDLRIDEVSRLITIPQCGEGKKQLTLAWNKIQAVSLQRRITKTPSGDYYSYLPAIDCAAGEAGSPTINLVAWGWTEARARAFGQWLGQQLGVEFREEAANEAGRETGPRDVCQ
jgi:hypothetical protein